jgi:membrane associated rhomboid family serine protease
MSDAVRNPDDYCYRHPDRLSFVLCEKCGRTICLECQNHVGGKVLCPDDARRANVTMLPVNARPKRPPRVRRTSRLLSRISETTPIVTYSLMGLIILLWLVDILIGAGSVELHLWFIPSALVSTAGNGAATGPWTLLTSMVSVPAGGDGFISVVFSGFSIFVLGRVLEREFGRAKFLLMYVLSGFGASVFALLFVGIVQGASSAIFGVLAVFAILMRKRGANMIWLYAVVAINIISIALSSSRAIIWQGTVGGLLVGAAVGFAYLLEGTPQKVRQQRSILISLVVVLLLAAILRSVT